MAQITVKNGQSVAASSSETEVLFPNWVRDVAFLIATGASGVQVTTGARGGQAVIGGSIYSFQAADKGIMTVEMADGLPQDGGRSIYIKGSGNIVFMF